MKRKLIKAKLERLQSGAGLLPLWARELKIRELQRALQRAN
jgi:hypothetical protein